MAKTIKRNKGPRLLDDDGNPIPRKKKRRDTHPAFDEPTDILGQGYNAATHTRIIVMGDAGELRGLYVDRKSRPKDKQGLFPLNFLAASFFTSIVGMLLSGPDAADIVPNENIITEEPPEGHDQLVSCGPPEGIRLFGARLTDKTYYMGIGPEFKTSRGESFTFGDLQVCAAALQEAMLAVMPEEDRERAQEMAALLRDIAEEDQHN
jgi:hypothetical protein